jgi:hypothetical protein
MAQEKISVRKYISFEPWNLKIKLSISGYIIHTFIILNALLVHLSDQKSSAIRQFGKNKPFSRYTTFAPTRRWLFLLPPLRTL